MGAPEATQADVLLATHEAAANAIERATSNESVVVRAEASSGQIAVEVHDHGDWTSGTPPSGELGLGLELFAKLVSRLELERTDRETTLRLLHRW